MYHSDQPLLDKQAQLALVIMDEALKKTVAKLEKGIKYNFFQDEIFIDPQSEEEMNMAMDILQEVFV